jgi:Legionella pneumophila major outer membrane protein precursor
MAAAVLLLIQPVAGGPPGFCDEWSVGAHALYFTPITCPYSYASSLSAVPAGTDTRSGRAQLLPCDGNWGFRVFGNSFNDCLFAGMSYQRFDVTTTRSFIANDLRVPGSSLSGAGRATGQVSVEYQNVDVRVGRTFQRGSISALCLYGNARWVDISYRRGLQASFPSGSKANAREKSELSGGAIGIGVGGEVDIWCGLGAFVDGNVLGVIGKRSLKNVEFKSVMAGFAPQVRRVTYAPETCVLPEADFRIGFNYTYACGCWEVVGEIGYEIDYFWNGSVFPNLVGVDIGIGGTREIIPVCEDLGFSGLFVGARLIF